MDRASADILGHIVPTRTNALGQVPATGVGSVIASPVNLNSSPYNFGNANQGHCAQFYSNYATRKDYWQSLLQKFDFKIRSTD